MKNKGQIMEQVLMWGAGLIATGAMAFVGVVNSKTEDLASKDVEIIQRVTVVETENKQFKDDVREIKMLIKEQNTLIQELNKKIR